MRHSQPPLHSAPSSLSSPYRGESIFSAAQRHDVNQPRSQRIRDGARAGQSPIVITRPSVSGVRRRRRRSNTARQCIITTSSKMGIYGNPELTKKINQQSLLQTTSKQMNLWKEFLWAIPRATALTGIIGPIIDALQNYEALTVTEDVTAKILVAMATTFAVNLTIQEAQVIAKNFSRERHTTWDSFCFLFNEFTLIAQQTAVHVCVAGFWYESSSGNDGAGNVSQYLMAAFIVLNLLQNLYLETTSFLRTTLKWIDQFILKSKPVMRLLESCFDGAALFLFIGYLVLKSGGINPDNFDTLGRAMVGTGAGVGGTIALFRSLTECLTERVATMKDRLLFIGAQAISFVRAATRGSLIALGIMTVEDFCIGGASTTPGGVTVSALGGLIVGIEHFLNVLETEMTKKLRLEDLEQHLLEEMTVANAGEHTRQLVATLEKTEAQRADKQSADTTPADDSAADPAATQEAGPAAGLSI